MAASTSDRNTQRRSGQNYAFPIAAATKIYGGILIALNASGLVVAAADTAALRVIGVSDEQVDNSAGSAGDLLVNLRRGHGMDTGVFAFDNSTTNALDADDIGKQCYVEDDHTVAETSTNKIKAGRFMGFVDGDATQCWVDVEAANGSFGSYAATTTAISTADGSDAATTQALANATKAKVNTLITDVANLAAALN